MNDRKPEYGQNSGARTFGEVREAGSSDPGQREGGGAQGAAATTPVRHRGVASARCRGHVTPLALRVIAATVFTMDTGVSVGARSPSVLSASARTRTLKGGWDCGEMHRSTRGGAHFARWIDWLRSRKCHPIWSEEFGNSGRPQRPGVALPIVVPVPRIMACSEPLKATAVVEDAVFSETRRLVGAGMARPTRRPPTKTRPPPGEPGGGRCLPACDQRPRPPATGL